MHNQIFNTLSNHGRFYSSLAGTLPFTAVFQVCLQCYLIEVLYPPKIQYKIQIIIGFIQLELLLLQIRLFCSSCSSEPFFILHPAPLRWLGLRLFFCSLFLQLSEVNSRIDLTLHFWYCSKCSSIDTAGNALTGKEGQMEMHFVLCAFSAQRNVPNLEGCYTGCPTTCKIHHQMMSSTSL